MIVHGSSSFMGKYCAGQLLNAVFGFSLVDGAPHQNGIITSAAAATACASGPFSLPNNLGTSFLNTSSLPVGSQSLYVGFTSASVVLILFGSGQIAYLGWDWVSAQPLGTANGGWLSILDCVVEEIR